MSGVSSANIGNISWDLPCHFPSASPLYPFNPSSKKLSTFEICWFHKYEYYAKNQNLNQIYFLLKFPLSHKKKAPRGLPSPRGRCRDSVTCSGHILVVSRVSYRSYITLLGTFPFFDV